MNKVSNFVNKNSHKLLWLAIILYAIIFSAICIWKYSHFLYNALDLAIINNVFYNTLHGSWWWSSIQGHSYLGDHFTPILIILLPIYYLWQSPEILLILQSLFLALAAWPIYKISQLILKNDKLALGLGILWLINPLVHNINLYEFHFIALLPFFFLMAFYYYLKLKKKSDKKIFLYLCTYLFLCLLVREDISFILLFFLIVTFFDLRTIGHKTRLKLILFANSLLLILAWVAITTKIIAAFSPSSFSPFAYYYNWLFNSNLTEILKHIFSFGNFEMIIGFLLPFLFIPLVKPKWLLLALAPLAQIIFSASGGGALVWQMHYGALFLPTIIIAFIYGFKKINKFIFNKLKSNYLLIFILIIINIYLGPNFGAWENDKTKKALDFNMISKNSSILASFNYLPNFSSRSQIYSLHYYFLDVQQFAQAPYIIEKKPAYIILNQDDYKYYDSILKTSAWARLYYIKGYKRIKKLLADYEQIAASNQTILFRALKD